MLHILKEVMENISIDCVIFGFEKSEFKILLMKYIYQDQHSDNVLKQ